MTQEIPESRTLQDLSGGGSPDCLFGRKSRALGLESRTWAVLELEEVPNFRIETQCFPLEWAEFPQSLEEVVYGS